MNQRPGRARLADSPLLDRLNEEDLVIANGFHDAETVVRQLVAELLIGPEPDRVLTFVRRLHALPNWLPIFEGLLAVAEGSEPPHEGQPTAK